MPARGTLLRVTYLSARELQEKEALWASDFYQHGWERIIYSPSGFYYVRRDMIPGRIVHHRNSR